VPSRTTATVQVGRRRYEPHPGRLAAVLVFLLERAAQRQEQQASQERDVEGAARTEPSR